MTEEDTFVQLSRASFEEVFQAYGEGLLQLTHTICWLIAEVEEEPPKWRERFPGWAWEEFQNECRQRSNDD